MHRSAPAYLGKALSTTCTDDSRPVQRNAQGTRPVSDGVWAQQQDTSRPATASPTELSGLYGALIEADDRGDAQALARLGWSLFAIASEAQQAHNDVAAELHEVLTAARAATAGNGSPGAVGLLRHVLARHGWLPPADATPLQVLAASSPISRKPGLISFSLARRAAASDAAADAASASPVSEWAAATSVSASASYSDVSITWKMSAARIPEVSASRGSPQARVSSPSPSSARA